MTPAGKKVLPSLAKNSFKPEPWVIDAIKADKQAWKNHRQFHPLYVRVRIYNVMFYWKRNVKGDHETALKMLDRYTRAAHDGKMIGEWNHWSSESRVELAPLCRVVTMEGRRSTMMDDCWIINPQKTQ